MQSKSQSAPPYSSTTYRIMLNSARIGFDRCIRMARYETKHGSTRFATPELRTAATYREMILENKRNMFAALRNEIDEMQAQWVGPGHDPSGNEW
jgi:hypothetical protein